MQVACFVTKNWSEKRKNIMKTKFFAAILGSLFVVSVVSASVMLIPANDEANDRAV